MPISKPRRPLVILAGRVIAVEPKEKYNDAGGRTGEVERHDVSILQAGSAVVDVRFPYTANGVAVPELGANVALVADIGETREYGANLRIVRYVGGDDVDALVGLVSAPAGK